VAAALTITYVVPEITVVMPRMMIFRDDGLSAMVVGVVRIRGGKTELIGGEEDEGAFIEGADCSGMLRSVVGDREGLRFSGADVGVITSKAVVAGSGTAWGAGVLCSGKA
jgi:hypothetical protein